VHPSKLLSYIGGLDGFAQGAGRIGVPVSILDRVSVVTVMTAALAMPADAANAMKLPVIRIAHREKGLSKIIVLPPFFCSCRAGVAKPNLR
jgi:hypothetical protein